MNKQTVTVSITALFLAILCVFSLSACGNKAPWKDAYYKEDTTLGTGSKTVEVEVQVEEHRVLFTIQTDKSTLGEALLELDLIEGEEGAYGLYIKKVNGVTADFDKDGHYWGFYQNGEYMLVGVDSTTIVGGEHFELVYAK